MQDFGLPPYDEPDEFGDLLREPQDDFDIFADPFEALFNPFGSEPLQEAEPDMEGQFQADIDHMEKSIENSPPQPHHYETDSLDGILGQLEESIEGTEIPPAADSQQKLFQDKGWGQSMPSTGVHGPPSDLYDYPSSSPGKGKDSAPVGHRWGKTNSTFKGDGKIFCPLEDDYISRQKCEEKDCQYYDPEIHECRHGEEPQDTDDIIGTERQLWCPFVREFVDRRICKDKNCQYYDLGECFYDNRNRK